MLRADASRRRCAIYTRKSSEEGLEQERGDRRRWRERVYSSACDLDVQSGTDGLQTRRWREVDSNLGPRKREFRARDHWAGARCRLRALGDAHRGEPGLRGRPLQPARICRSIGRAHGRWRRERRRSGASDRPNHIRAVRDEAGFCASAAAHSLGYTGSNTRLLKAFLRSTGTRPYFRMPQGSRQQDRGPKGAIRSRSDP
jgi:hypothetical protein